MNIGPVRFVVSHSHYEIWTFYSSGHNDIIREPSRKNYHLLQCSPIYPLVKESFVVKLVAASLTCSNDRIGNKEKMRCDKGTTGASESRECPLQIVRKLLFFRWAHKNSSSGLPCRVILNDRLGLGRTTV